MIPLKSIVQDYMAEEGRSTPHKFDQFLHFGIRGLEELHYEVDGVVKREVLTPTSAGTVPLPFDFVKEVRIAIADSVGNLIWLGRNGNIYKPLSTCGSETNPSGGGVEGVSSTYVSASQHIKNGEIIGAYYGVGGRSTAGEFRINQQKNQIELSSNLANSNVILDYIANPEMVNGEFMVHPFLREPLMNYIEMASKRRFVSRGEAAALRRTYVKSKDWAKMKFDGMSYEESLEISRKNFMLAPKY